MEVGRLAFRHEGKWWNCYWTPDQHSMKRATKLGSILMTLVEGPAREAFMEAMRQAFANITKEMIGATPEWRGERPAPEKERKRHA